MNNNNLKTYYENRVNKSNSIDETLYISGLIDMLEFLMLELKGFLKDEGRFFGLAKSYMNSIDEANKKINNGRFSEGEIDVFEKILFLYKPILINEFKRLKEKKLSSGDSVICLSRKILSIILETENHPNKKEIKTIKKLIDKFFENIKNKAKNDPLYVLSNFIRTNFKNGWIGKYNSNYLQLEEKRELVIDKEVINGDNIRLEEGNNSKITEITWTEEQ